MGELTCFKAYDIRGEIGIDIDAGIAYRLVEQLHSILILPTLLLVETHARHHLSLQGQCHKGLWMLVQTF